MGFSAFRLFSQFQSLLEQGRNKRDEKKKEKFLEIPGMATRFRNLVDIQLGHDGPYS